MNSIDSLLWRMQSELNFVATFWLKNFIFTLILLDIQWDNIKTVSSCLNFLFTSFFWNILKILLRKLNGTLEGLMCMELDFIRMKVIVNIYPQAHFFTSSVCWLSIFFVSLFTVGNCCCCWLLFPMADNFRDFPCVGNFERNTALSNLEICIKIEFNAKNRVWHRLKRVEKTVSKTFWNACENVNTKLKKDAFLN